MPGICGSVIAMAAIGSDNLQWIRFAIYQSYVAIGVNAAQFGFVSFLMAWHPNLVNYQEYWAIFVVVIEFYGSVFAIYVYSHAMQQKKED